MNELESRVHQLWQAQIKDHFTLKKEIARLEKAALVRDVILAVICVVTAWLALT